jgi:pyrimidine operon attenuation protein/uracil phosphoribosyltransferase
MRAAYAALFFHPPRAVRLWAMIRLLAKQAMQDTLEQMARRIAGAAPRDAAVALVGIRRRGEPLARRLVPLLEKAGRPAQHVGVLDITLYRDDLTTIGPKAVLRGTEIDFDITGTWLVLVDDVLFTGRSVRAALDALIDLGRPRAIRLAVLVDRGGRELPIQPDFVGLRTEVESCNEVRVSLEEIDGADEVTINDSDSGE